MTIVATQRGEDVPFSDIFTVFGGFRNARDVVGGDEHFQRSCYQRHTWAGYHRSADARP
jgi:hypothetical protein